MANLTSRREVKIGVAPFHDGSGYEAAVRAWVDGDDPVFEIEGWRVAAVHWPELRQAVEDALALVSRPSPEAEANE